tara:strand:+ start:272 stop:1819 length:1548 start_codon:yes stop_codon:yes gene_type:complete
MTISTQPLKGPDGQGYGVEHTVSFEGDLLLDNATERNSGINGVFNKIEILKSALSQDGRFLDIRCGSGTVLKGFPTIESYSINNESDNFTERAGYSIEMKMPTLASGSTKDAFNGSTDSSPYIESCSETWDVEVQDESTSFVFNGERFGYKLAVTHTVDVQAKIQYTGVISATKGATTDGTFGVVWEQAKAYASGKLGYDNDFVKLTGVLNVPGVGLTGLGVYNNFRRVSTNKTQGSINIVETFIVTPEGTTLPNNAYEDFDISIDQSEGLITVGVQGNIQGLISNVYDRSGDYVTPSGGKYESAKGYFQALGEGRIYDRANHAYSGLLSAIATGDCNFGYLSPTRIGVGGIAARGLNPRVRNQSIATNVRAGTINYNYTFDSAPSGIITGLAGKCVISENVTIDDQLAADVFASVTVLGRAAGPILQDIGTTTARTRSVSIDLVVLPPTGFADYNQIYSTVPTGQVEHFITTLTGNIFPPTTSGQIFINQNTQNFNLTTGRYTKSFGITYNRCK